MTTTSQHCVLLILSLYLSVCLSVYVSPCVVMVNVCLSCASHIATSDCQIVLQPAVMVP